MPKPSWKKSSRSEAPGHGSPLGDVECLDDLRKRRTLGAEPAGAVPIQACALPMHSPHARGLSLLDCLIDGGVAELAYAGDLKSSAFGIVGSSPTAPTTTVDGTGFGAVSCSGPPPVTTTTAASSRRPASCRSASHRWWRQRLQAGCSRSPSARCIHPIA